MADKNGYGFRNWVFTAITRDKKGLKYLDLIEPTQIPIRRHIKIKAEATPYDPDYTGYFIKRHNLRKGKRLYRPCGKTWSYWWDMENANDNCISWAI